jgi:hypothetical protein
VVKGIGRLFIFDEMGHAYNYFVVHNQDPRFGLRMIPCQLLYGSLIMPVLLKLSNSLAGFKI